MVKLINNIKSKFYWDSYTKILHVGKIMINIGGFTDWAFHYCRVDASNRPYIRIGKVAIRF